MLSCLQVMHIAAVSEITNLLLPALRTLHVRPPLLPVCIAPVSVCLLKGAALQLLMLHAQAIKEDSVLRATFERCCYGSAVCTGCKVEGVLAHH